ncbi:nuclear transport factor 2 family protein [Sphingomicrobium flavum]|uniref:nuclear transport factor 2 family protein n=1 Tax=Sphingomicrobium flavum TaxID=1229164 RepID=UPI0021ADEA8E|nr:nuclear transport factor 2 family protein [Sphingomicrobium flavum]
MADIAAKIETLEHALMRAWLRGDRKTMKPMLASDFRLVVGARTSQLLDRASFLEAAAENFVVEAYRLDDIYVRRHGKTIFLIARAEMEMKLGGEDWSGSFWLIDLWRKGTVRRGWRLVERSLSRPDSGEDISAIVRSLQLWR